MYLLKPAALNGSFLEYADKIYHFIAPKILGDNTGKSAFDGKSVEKISQTVNFEIEKVQLLPPDIELIYKKCNRKN